MLLLGQTRMSVEQALQHITSSSRDHPLFITINSFIPTLPQAPPTTSTTATTPSPPTTSPMDMLFAQSMSMTKKQPSISSHVPPHEQQELKRILERLMHVTLPTLNQLVSRLGDMSSHVMTSHVAMLIVRSYLRHHAIQQAMTWHITFITRIRNDQYKERMATWEQQWKQYQQHGKETTTSTHPSTTSTSPKSYAHIRLSADYYMLWMQGMMEYLKVC